MQHKVVVIDNLLDPPLHRNFDFCTRYYTDFKYGRTSADYEKKNDSDSRYFFKLYRDLFILLTTRPLSILYDNIVFF